MTGVDLGSWVIAAPGFLVSLAILFVPGLAIGVLIRLRGLWLAAVAPAISLTTMGLGSIALSAVGLTWSLASIAAFTTLFGVLVVLLFRLVLKSRPSQKAERSIRGWPTVLAWAVGGISLGIYTIFGVGIADNISQTFDNIFHLNTIAEITRSGSASPFTVGLLVAPDGGQSFYPDGWHAIVQLVVQLSGVSVPVAINAFNIAVAVTIWPLGILLLVRQLVGSSPSATLTAGIFLAAFPAAPLALLYYGVLYPFFLGIALVPVVLALVVNLLGLAREDRLLGSVAQVVLLAGVIPGITLAHPGAMMGALAFSVPLAIIAAFAGWKIQPASHRWWRAIGLALFLVAGFAMLYKLRPGVVWGPRLSPLRAAWETVTLSLGGYGLPIIAAVLMIIGLVIAVLRPDKTNLAMVGMWIMGAGLFFITAGISHGVLRGPTGVWYADTPRLAALYPIVVIPLIAFGAVALINLLTSRKRHSGPISATVLLLMFGATFVSAGYDEFVPKMRQSYTATATSALLSPEEITLLNEVRDIVPEGTMIAGNPWTGTSLAYALANRPVILPHVFMKEISDDRDEVLNHLKEATPAACEAAENLGLEYVLDFGEQEVHGGKHTFPGIDGLENSSAFELVLREGPVTLYRLTACG